MTPRYGVLLVTGGHTHQESYATAFAADPRCKIVAVTDEADVSPRRRKLNEAFAKAMKVPYIADLAEALARKDVQVASVCTEPERRGRVALRCAEAGKHLYLDKSLTPRLAEADALVKAVAKAGVKSHMFSFIPTAWARQGKALVESGALGEIVAVHADNFFAKGKPGTADPAKPRKESDPPDPATFQTILAKREWDNVGVYPVTLAAWLTGKPFRGVYGVTGNFWFAEHQTAGAEDFGLLSGTLEGGVPVTISAGRFGWTTHPAAGVNRVLLIGTKQTAVIDMNRPRLEVFTDETPWTPPLAHPEDPMFFWQSTQDEMGVKPKKTYVAAAPAAKSDAAYFLDCLDANRESELSVREAAHAAEVLLAVYRSATTGRPVTLPLQRESAA